MSFNKKAALDLSIQTIVIVVIAMTLLGLGLGFVKSIFGNLGSLEKSTFSKISEQLNTDLITSDNILIFSKIEHTIERGEGSLEGFGVRNDGQGPMKYGIKVITVECPAPGGSSTTDCKASTVDAPSWFSYIKGDEKYLVKAADRDVNQVQINVPRGGSAIPGRYLLQIVGYAGFWDDAAGCNDDYDDNAGTGCTKFGQTTFFLRVA